MPILSRRDFLRTVVIGGAGALLMAGAAGAVALLWPNRSQSGRVLTDITVRRAGLPAPGGRPYLSRDGNFYLIVNQGGALALYWACTHRGCTVWWQDERDRFECPCHGAVFDRHGERLAGPAPRPMDLMELRIDEDGNVHVDTREIIQRTEYRPEQAVPLNV